MSSTQYRERESERNRTADLLSLIPRGCDSVLEIGAHDGHFSRILPEYFNRVTALDLTKPPFQIDRVTTVSGDVTKLQFPDRSFDCILCTEVLEHVPALEAACREISRVASREIILGVPFRQDIRIGRLTCAHCGGISPPWGHVNSFNEQKLVDLFPEWKVRSRTFVGTNSASTTGLATFLMDLAGNPWGDYGQDEPCIHCGAKFVAPRGERSIWKRVCSLIALRMNQLQDRIASEHPYWIHLALVRKNEA